MPSTHLAPIVLAEDNKDDALFVERALDKARIRNPLVVLSSVSDVRTYLSRYNGVSEPVLLIIDLQLEGGESGLDALAWVRTQPGALGTIPAMILTASERADDRELLRRERGGTR